MEVLMDSFRLPMVKEYQSLIEANSLMVTTEMVTTYGDLLRITDGEQTS